MTSPSLPNIVFVLADDLPNWAVGCYGNDEIRTPNIDLLASDGLRFTNFFCTSPVCSPARASLLTGTMPSTHGVQDWIRGGNGDHGEPIEYLSGQRSYPQVLADNGYTCGISGKWHLGNSPKPQLGFEHWFTHPSGGSAYNDVPMYRDGALTPTSGYLTDVITDDAIDFIEKHAHAQQPFFLNVTYTAPHSPWVDQHPQELVDSYADCAFDSCPQEPRHPWVPTHPIELNNSEINASPGREVVTIRDQLQGYFASVTALDAAIGRLRGAIQEWGITEETVFIVSSDNGFNCGHHGIWGKGNATLPQNMYDSSVKVPFIFSHPGTVERGGVTEEMVSGYDFMPTILDYVGLWEPQPELPGTSFVGTLLPDRDGLPETHGERAVVIYDEFGPTRMIRTHDWKYIHRYPYGPHEFYHLRLDPDERINLLTDERVLDPNEVDRFEIAAQMRSQLEVWFDRFTDPVMDGRVQAITGRGQLNRVGPAGVGLIRFHDLEEHKTNDS